ncbi:MAG: lipid A deacylase LpxR family protein [Phycisphaerae bacterium]|nr:lipid A deacylase LpxR family protein [Phycisphaerae bacterium]
MKAYSREPYHAFDAYWDNDGTFLKPNGRTDRHYTNGVKFSYTTKPDWDWLERFGRWHFGDADKTIDTSVGLFITQDMYTPDHIGHPEQRQLYDYNFAGWLHGGFFVQRLSESKMEHFEMDLGVIGSSSGTEETQRWIHNLVEAEIPVGWENQLRDEFTVEISYQKKHILDGNIFKRTPHTQFIPEYGFTLGSVHRHVQAGLLFRVGYDLPGDFGPGRITSPHAALRAPSHVNDHSAYAFVRLGGKAVQFNRFLSGLSHEPLTGEIQAGLTGQYKNIKCTYSQTFTTHQYKEETRSDSYGTLSVGIEF